MKRGLDDEENNDYNGEDYGDYDDEEVEEEEEGGCAFYQLGPSTHHPQLGGDVSAPADASAPVMMLVYICFIRTVCKK